MSDHPIRLLVTDDLKRSRLTVGVRVVLAIPHYIWLLAWSLIAFLAALANWLLTLLLGRSPRPLHHFLAAYVKYVTQFSAYMRIAANPYPSFDGPDGYPVDLRIAPAAKQSRLTVLFRLPLALPAILLSQLLGGSYGGGSWRRARSVYNTGGLGLLVSVLAWFVGVAQRRTPRGLRDTAAWSVGYGAQLWAYLLMLTDRYPDSDPLAMLAELPARSDPVTVSSEDDLRRSRLTVLFRLPLSFPHLLWLALWTLLALPAAFLNWLATLVAGRPPALLHRFLSRYLRYLVSVYAFLFVVVNPFPGFAGAPGTYRTLETEIAPAARQSRWKVGFRLLLAIPAWAVASAYGSLLFLLGVFNWFSSLVRGRAPRGLRTTGTVALRYIAATYGYLLVLTDAYPYTGPLRSDGPAATLRSQEPELETPDEAAPFAYAPGAVDG